MKLSQPSIIVTLLILLGATFFVTLFIGRYFISPYTILLMLASKFFYIQPSWTLVDSLIVWSIRFPRALTVILVGAGLAVSGATFQGMFRNPLVSESILGVQAGASVGATIAIITNQNFYTLQIFAFAFGLLAVGLTYLISRFWGGNQTLVLVLAGIIIGSLFTAMLSLMEYLYANPASSVVSKLPNILFWLLGSFAAADWTSVYELAPILITCMIILFLLRWRLNALSMGDEEARALGVNTTTLKAIFIVCVTLITAASISICGTIGWIGLVIPQISRMLGGPDNKILIPSSMLLGASFLLIVDTLCRSLVSYEIPISIVTSIVGAPVFLYILKKNSEAWP